MPRKLVWVTGLGTLVVLKILLKKTVFRYQLTFDICASTYELKKSSKSKFGAEFVATITYFGEANKFFKNRPLIAEACSQYIS